MSHQEECNSKIFNETNDQNHNRSQNDANVDLSEQYSIITKRKSLQKTFHKSITSTDEEIRYHPHLHLMGIRKSKKDEEQEKERLINPSHNDNQNLHSVAEVNPINNRKGNTLEICHNERLCIESKCSMPKEQRAYHLESCSWNIVPDEEVQGKRNMEIFLEKRQISLPYQTDARVTTKISRPSFVMGFINKKSNDRSLSNAMPNNIMKRKSDRGFISLSQEPVLFKGCNPTVKSIYYSKVCPARSKLNRCQGSLKKNSVRLLSQKEGEMLSYSKEKTSSNSYLTNPSRVNKTHIQMNVSNSDISSYEIVNMPRVPSQSRTNAQIRHYFFNESPFTKNNYSTSSIQMRKAQSEKTNPRKTKSTTTSREEDWSKLSNEKEKAYHLPNFHENKKKKDKIQNLTQNVYSVDFLMQKHNLNSSKKKSYSYVNLAQKRNEDPLQIFLNNEHLNHRTEELFSQIIVEKERESNSYHSNKNSARIDTKSRENLEMFPRKKEEVQLDEEKKRKLFFNVDDFNFGAVDRNDLSK